MKLLIIEAGTSKLPSIIVHQAGFLRPSIENTTVMNIDVHRLNIPAFKHTLSNLIPDVVILHPPYLDDTKEVPDKWTQLVLEIARHTEMLYGKLLLISSVDVLGDSQIRNEDAITMPFNANGELLQRTEHFIEQRTWRHYIMRFPFTIEDPMILRLMKEVKECKYLRRKDDMKFNLIGLEDMARIILERVQLGWYGKYHPTTQDVLETREVCNRDDIDENSRTPDRTLTSKHDWSIVDSKDTWNNLIEQ
jgi:dTDP-4-dehydrorhamnose reductase